MKTLNMIAQNMTTMDNVKVNNMKKKSTIWFGLLILVVGIIGLIAAPGENVEGRLFYHLWGYKSLIMTLILFVLLIPAIEEFIFREWSIRHRNEYYLSSFMMMGLSIVSIFAAQTAVGRWMGIVAALISTVLCVVMFIRRRVDNANMFIIGATMVLALVHLSQHRLFGWSTLWATMYLIGLSLICFYFAFRWKWWVALIIHVVCNGLIAADANVDINKAIEIIVPEGGEVRLHRAKSFEWVCDTIGDTLYLQGLPSVMASNIQNRQNDNLSVIYNFQRGSQSDGYQLIVHPLSCISHNWGEQLVEQMLSEGIMEADTEYVDFYWVNGIIGRADSCSSCTIRDAILQLRKMGVFAVPYEGLNMAYPTACLPSIEGNISELQPTEICQYFSQQYGILLTPSADEKACKIIYR